MSELVRVTTATITGLAVVGLLACVIGDSLLPALPIAAAAWAVWQVAKLLTER